jgi:hypothetical protein
MSRNAKWEYLKAIYPHYRKAGPALRRQILDEFCATCGYHRKYAIRLLNGPPPRKPRTPRRGRRPIYGPRVMTLLTALWEAAGYPCSSRLKALLPLWLPWARRRFGLTADLEQQVRAISPATIDRRLKAHKDRLRRTRYGRTKPGTLLKHHIAIKTEHWDVQAPGFCEVDLVSHSGNAADGEFLHSLNVTDIHTTWVETRAVLGKGQAGVVQALDEIRQVLPFALQGIDADNGSEFINHHLKAFCEARHIQFTRSRPYKKDDNAHIEQKNWTHVRKLVGYVRYDSPLALAAMNALYRQELRLLQNLFLPSVKLVRKERIGSKLKRVYDAPQTPFQRVQASAKADPQRVAALRTQLETLDPFELAHTIDQQLQRLYQLANHRRSPAVSRSPETPDQERITPGLPVQ